MDARPDFHWRTSSPDDRKQLHAVAKSLCRATGLTWNQIFHAALGQTFGDDYEDNFRAGRIARKHCAKLHNWMRLKHPQHAADLDRILAAPGSLPPLPRRAVRFIRNYVGYKIEFYTGHRPSPRDVKSAELTRLLRQAFFSERESNLHITSMEKLKTDVLKASGGVSLVRKLPNTRSLQKLSR